MTDKTEKPTQEPNREAVLLTVCHEEVVASLKEENAKQLKMLEDVLADRNNMLGERINLDAELQNLRDYCTRLRAAFHHAVDLAAALDTPNDIFAERR